MLPYKIYTQKKIFNYYTGMSFFLFIWISRHTSDETRLVRHEKIHFWQQVEMLFIFHWIFYGLFYLVGRMKGHCHYVAYRYNPFELEAFTNDAQVDYLETRRPFAWAGFLKKYYEAMEEDHSQKVPKDKRIIWDRSPRR